MPRMAAMALHVAAWDGEHLGLEGDYDNGSLFV